jgi:Protein of unknown function (DUF3891)
MIIRTSGEHLLLITQPDHARLAADIASAWEADGFATNPRRPILLLATREHDNGWIEPDSAPEIDPTSGRPYDFLSAPSVTKQAVWPRAVERLELVDPLAAAFVAEHALTVLNDYRSNPAWRSFFDRLTTSRNALLKRCNIDTRQARGEFTRDYRLLYLADYLSLAFCNLWSRSCDASGYRFGMQDNELQVSPDPFSGRRVDLSVSARRIPNCRYASTADMRRALAHGETVCVSGMAVGAAVASDVY